MRTLSITEARKNIYKLIKEVSDNNEPIQITGKNNNAVLVSEDDWRAIQETIYLLSIPNMRESIIKGVKSPLSEATDTLKW
ncbi:MAG: type II toxin-antitoxin system prevent-host-death family antitoxin [Bacteroidetes bacterium]|nr:MAG: type II toxin-antitoxin system prevent-host-death family antitoxin [Bacteroidota bacterium]